MGLRFRKSIKILPGLKLNLSKSGISTSVGGPGHTVNFSSRGTKATFGIPGTGISYTQNLSPQKERTPSTRRRGAIGTYSAEGGFNCEAGYIQPEVVERMKDKHWHEKYRVLALCVSIFGIFGAHRYYTGKYWTGLLYTLTCGLFFIGWITDLGKIIKGTYRDSDGMPLMKKSDLESMPFLRQVPERKFSIPRCILHLFFFALLCVFVRDKLPELLQIEADKNIFIYFLIPTFFSFLYLLCWRKV